METKENDKYLLYGLHWLLFEQLSLFLLQNDKLLMILRILFVF